MRAIAAEGMNTNSDSEPRSNAASRHAVPITRPDNLFHDADGERIDQRPSRLTWEKVRAKRGTMRMCWSPKGVWTLTVAETAESSPRPMRAATSRTTRLSFRMTVPSRS